MDTKDKDYALVTAIERRTRKSVRIEFKKDRSPYGTYLIVGNTEYRMSNRLDTWRSYLHERNGNVRATRVLLDNENKMALLIPYPTVSKRQRRKNVLEILSKSQLTEQERDIEVREHFERVNEGYYDE